MCSGWVRAAVAAAMLWTSGWTQASPAVSVDSAVVGSGATFTVDIRITDAVDLIGWQFSLAFDPLRLQAQTVSEGTFLSSAGTTVFSPGLIDNGSGLVSLVTDSFVDLVPPSGDGVIARVEFTALADGLSPLTLADVFLNFSDSGFSVADGAVCVGGRSLTDCPAQPPEVPEPGTLALAALAAGVSASRRWRRPGR